jgi:hypothetical protein
MILFPENRKPKIQITSRLDEDDFDNLKKVALENEVTVSEIVRLAIKSYLPLREITENKDKCINFNATLNVDVPAVNNSALEIYLNSLCKELQECYKINMIWTSYKAHGLGKCRL